MTRFFRVSLLAVVALVVATGAFANIPDRDLSTVPDILTMTPDGSFEIVITINGQIGPVNGSFVEIEFSPQATGDGTFPGLIAWTVPVPVGADVPSIGPGGGYLFSKATDANGEVRFKLAGGGCVADKIVANPNDPYIAQIRADNFVMNESGVNNPDAVRFDGELAEDLEYSICEGPLDPAPGTISVGLADALFHTPPIKQGTVEICTKFTAPYTDPVGLGDAGVLTPYVKGGTTSTCTYVGP